MSNSIKVGLTGNYLSGLDYVVSIFKRYKIPVFDCDIMIKYLLYNSEEHIEKIRDIFGEDVFTDGVVDISKFDGIYNSTGDLKFHVLLKLLEYDIIKFYEGWRLNHQKSPYTIFKSQILFEFGFHTSMNLNINCLRPIKYRATELHDYFNYEYADAYKLLETEMCEKNKDSFSTYTIYNYDNYPDSVEAQIEATHKSLKNKSNTVIDLHSSAADYVD